MSGFTKLFSSITSSSIWNESDKTRIVWITMLAMAEADGVVRASVGGLAHVARVSRRDCEAALERLMSPDTDSRSPENDGRRIQKVDGGFFLLNYGKYREARSEDERKAYMREYMRDYRKQSVNNSKQDVNSSKPPLAEVSHGKPQLAKTEGEEEGEKKDSLPTVRRTPTLDEVIAYGRDQGNVPQNVCEIWWNDHEARPLDIEGRYTDKGGCAVENWKAALRGFSLRWRDNEQKFKMKGSTAPKPSAPIVTETDDMRRMREMKEGGGL